MVRAHGIRIPSNRARGPARPALRPPPPAPILSPMANKSDRHGAIRDIIESRAVGSQEELRRLLVERGWEVTQSTLSRDLREMRLARVPTPDGARYQFTEDSGAEQSRAILERLLPQLFVNVDGVGELVVLHTLSGGAQAVAEALDGEEFAETLGTIAGDNTILVICRSAAAREAMIRRIRELARA